MSDSLKVIIKISVILFVVEVAIMILIDGFFYFQNPLLSFSIDAMLLAAVAAPFIYQIIKKYHTHNDALSILLRASRELSSTLDFEVVLQTAIDSATNLLELHTGALYLLYGDNLYLGATTPSLPPGFPDNLRSGSIDEHPHLKKAASEGVPVALEDVCRVELSPAEQAVVEQRRLCSLLFLPLMVQGQAVGVLILGTSGKHRAFMDSEISLYSTLANQMALTITNAHLHRNIQDHAAILEREVLLRTEELSKTNLALQEEVKEHQKTEAELIMAKDTAEKANESKSIFLANMSHEIRTPMNGVIGMLHLALQADLDEKQRNHIEKSLYSAESLLRILNDILDLSKIESGNLELENADFNLKGVIDGVVNIVGIRANERAIRFTVKIDKDVPRNLTGDPLRLTQVLNNLAGNAIKFCKAGDKITLRVSKINSTDNQTVLKFDVEDTGVGISPEQQNKLFKAFSQADSSTTRKYGGTGLGLVISRQIVDMMGGELWVDSRLGIGSTFSFTIKLGLPSDNSIENLYAETSNQNSTDAITSLYGAKILVVEDNEINQEILLELLTSNGLMIEAAYNGQEALELLEDESFDVVLMDCQMPIMDGYEATRRIRGMSKHKYLPIIALTANAMASEREKVLSAGMNEHITKPIDPDSLFTTLSYWVKKTKSAS